MTTVKFNKHISADPKDDSDTNNHFCMSTSPLRPLATISCNI